MWIDGVGAAHDGSVVRLSSSTLSSRSDVLSFAGWLTVALPATVLFGPALIDICCSMIAVVFLIHVARERDTAWLDEPWVQAIGALWIFTIFRAALVGSPWLSLGLALSWIRYPLLAIALATWILQHAVWRERLLLSTAAVCGFLSLDALFQAAMGFDVIGRPLFEGRLTATMNRPRLGATLAWLFLPAVFGLLGRNSVKAAAALTLTCLTAILLSGDRMAFLFASVGLVLCAACIPAVRRNLWVLAIAAVVLVGGVLIARPDVYERQVRSTIEAARNLGTTHYGVIWSRALVMAGNHPIFGVGMNRYRDVCADASYGPIAQSSNSLSACAIHPHNIYLEWFVEGGLLAVSGFVAAMLFVARQLWFAGALLRTNFLYAALVVTVGLRLFPASTATSLTRSWFSMPLWLVIGWALALALATNPLRARDAS